MRSLISATLLALTVAACGEPKRIAVALPIPFERMDCVEAGNRPAIPPEYTINWQRVESSLTVPDAVRAARSEVAQYIGSIRTREGIVAGYVLMLEGHLFACSNDAQWLREWQAGIQ